MFYKNKAHCDWIKYFQFHWGLKRKNGVGIANESQYLCTKYTDIFYEKFIKSNISIPPFFKDNKHFISRFNESLRATISLLNRRVIELILLEEYISKDERNKNLKSDYRSIFFIKGTPNTYLLSSFFSGKKIILFSKFSSFSNLIFKNIIKAICFGDIKIINSIIFHRSAANSKQSNDGKIFVEYISRNFIGDRSLHIWHKHTEIKPSNIVLYFNRFDSPSSIENIQKVENEGFQWVDTKNIYCLSNPLIVWIIIIKEMIKVPFPKKFSFIEIWKYFIILNSLSEIIYWRDIFKKYNAKVILQIEEGSTLQYSQLLGINNIGGIMVGLTWSIPFSNVTPEEFFPQDVYFTWGPINRDWIINSHYRPKFLLTSGIVWDMSRENIDIGLSLRKKFNQKIKYVMTLTDMTFKDFTENVFKDYYITFLSYAINNPEWGVLIKPKKDRIWEKIDKNINKLVISLSSQKRLVIVKSHESPLVGSYASDICIGLLISSATILAASQGILSVCWDVSGTPGHPLYSSNNSIIISKNLSEIINIVDAIDKSQLGEKLDSRKDFGLDMIDPFQDGKGSERIGKFLSSYMYSIDKNIESSQALNSALSQYKLDHGNSCVLDITSETFDRLHNNNLWDESHLIN